MISMKLKQFKILFNTDIEGKRQNGNHMFAFIQICCNIPGCAAGLYPGPAALSGSAPWGYITQAVS